MREDQARRLLDLAAGAHVAGEFDAVHSRARRAHRRMRGALVAGTALAVAAAIVVPVAIARNSGGAGEPATPRTSSSPSIGATVHTNPKRLLGEWSVTARGVPKSTTVRIGAGITVHQSCGAMYGEWRADHHGLFVGQVYSGDRPCLTRYDGFSADWLSTVTGYRTDGSSRLLLDGRGAVVATLRPAPGATGRPSVPRRLTQVPVGLPPGVVPATMADLTLRRWQDAAGHPNPRSYLQFDATSDWSASDGCNGLGGRFEIGRGGELLVTSSGQTDVGCANSPVGVWLSQAARIGIAGGNLVLTDRGGTVLGRLAPMRTGVIVGRFREVGGPAPGTDRGLPGTIEVHQGGATGTVVGQVAATAGRFAIAVPPGRYILVGSSRSVPGASCPSVRAVVVRAGVTSNALVICQLR